MTIDASQRPQEIHRTIKEIERAITEDFNCYEAHEKTNVLYKIAISIIRDYSPTHQKENQILFSFNTPFSLLQILANPSIQYQDELRYSISKTSRIFLDLIFFKSIYERRKVILKEDSLNLVDDIIKSLPNSTRSPGAFIPIRLELDRIKGTLKAFNETKEWEKFLISGAETAVKRSIWDALCLIGRMWKRERQASDWFPLTLHWRLIAPKIDSLGHLDATKKEFQNDFKFYKRGNHFSLSVCDTLKELIQSSYTEQSVKISMLQYHKPNLLELACLEKRDDSKSYWETRCIAVKFLGDLSNDSQLEPKIREIIVDNLFSRIWNEQESYPPVKQILGSIFFMANLETKRIWFERIKTHIKASEEVTEKMRRKARDAKESEELLQEVQKKVGTLPEKMSEEEVSSLVSSFIVFLKAKVYVESDKEDGLPEKWSLTELCIDYNKKENKSDSLDIFKGLVGISDIDEKIQIGTFIKRLKELLKIVELKEKIANNDLDQQIFSEILKTFTDNSNDNYTKGGHA